MKRKTLTILFTDLQGYTSRTARQSRGENELLIKEMKSFVEKFTAKHNGTFVKAMGDGFLLTFESPTDGVACGQDMQAGIEKRNANILDQENFTQFRVGISTGEVNIDDDGDVYGDAVNIASRIQSFAEPNSVYISEATYLAMNRSEIQAQDLGLQQFKNTPERIRVYRALKPNETAKPLKKSKSLLPKFFLLIGVVVALACLYIFQSSVQEELNIDELMDQGRYEEVIHLAAQTLEHDPENLRYHELVIKSFIKLDQFEEAKNHLRGVLEFHPQGDELCTVTAEFLGQENQYQMASEWLKEYCEQQGRGELQVEQHTPEPSEKFQEPAMVADHQEQIQPQRYPAPEESIRQDEFQLMAEEAQRALDEDPGNIEALRQLGEAHFRMREYDRAEEILHELIGLVPDEYPLYYETGQLYEDRRIFDRAVRMYEEFIQRAPDGIEKAEAFKKITELQRRNDRLQRRNFRDPREFRQQRPYQPQRDFRDF